MATLLDVTALQHFSGLFPFLLVLVLSYAFLSKTDWLKDKQGTAVLIAVLLAFMTLLSSIAMKTINLMAPWVVLLIIFTLLFMLVFMVFGYSQKDITSFITSGEFGAGGWIMALMIIIGVGSLIFVVNQEFGGLENLGGEQAAVEGEVGFWQTIFHPKILGMALIMLIALLTIKHMTKMQD